MNFTGYIENFINLKTSDIHLGMIGKIEKFDANKMRADVQPLLKKENALGESITFPILIDIPVLFYKGGNFFIKPNYVSGDMVWIGFSSHDIENPLKNYTRNTSEKMFELHNACVLGGIAGEYESMPDMIYENGLVFGDSDGYGLILNDNVVSIGDSTGTFEPVILGDTFTTALNTFLTSIGSVVGGDPSQNAAAITAIAAAANILKAQVDTFKSEDVEVT